MGIGPWAQGDLIRDTQRAERARFRRLIDRYIQKAQLGETIQTLRVVRSEITPKKPKPKRKTLDETIAKYASA